LWRVGNLELFTFRFAGILFHELAHLVKHTKNALNVRGKRCEIGLLIGSFVSGCPFRLGCSASSTGTGGSVTFWLGRGRGRRLGLRRRRFSNQARNERPVSGPVRPAYPGGVAAGREALCHANLVAVVTVRSDHSDRVTNTKLLDLFHGGFGLRVRFVGKFVALANWRKTERVTVLAKDFDSRL